MASDYLMGMWFPLQAIVFLDLDGDGGCVHAVSARKATFYVM